MAGFLLVIWGIFAFTALLMRWNAMKYRQKGLPPGTMGLPVIGETLEFLKQGPNFMRRQRARYGNFFKTHILGSPTIISLDPEVNRYILLNEGKGLLPGYPQSLLDMLGKYNIASAHGPDHKFVRGTLISLISPTIIKDQLLLKCDEFMLSYLSNWDGKTIDIQDRTKDMILMLMLKMIANVESGPIPEAFKPEFLTLIDGTISLPLNIPGTHYYNGLKARENIISIIRRMIKERRACPSSQPDMLDSLLQIEDSNHKKISDENIIDQVITIIHSGYETVSTTTMMIIKYLHDHPKALQDLREEHLAIREQKQSSTDPITWEEYKTMRFTRAVIFETLRLAAVTNGGMRKTTRDMELNGYVVPKGWRIYLYTKELYHDPILYPEPLSFNPWRWTKDTNLEGHKYFMLFGRGGRLCAGKELALVVISIFLHYFVTKFRWEEIGECKLVEFPRVEAPNGLFIRVSNY